MSAVSVTQRFRAPFSTGCLRLRVDERVLLVARRSVSVGELRGGAGLRHEAAHLRVGQATGGLERVDPHVAGECACLVPAVDRLSGDRKGREADVGHVEPRLLGLGLDCGRGHVGRADDLLLLEAVLDGRVSVDAHDDRCDSKSDQHGGGDHPSNLENLPHDFLLPSRRGCLFASTFSRSLGGSGPVAIGAQPRAFCGITPPDLRVSRTSSLSRCAREVARIARGGGRRGTLRRRGPWRWRSDDPPLFGRSAASRRPSRRTRDLPGRPRVGRARR